LRVFYQIPENMEKVSVFWFRRDLRLEDNRGLQEALLGPFPVLPVFIFDDNILDELEVNDPGSLSFTTGFLT